jgi:hypothetical protein
MMDPQTTARLHDLVRRESLSVLMYVDEAYPWTTARDSAALPKLKGLIAEEKKALTALGRFLVRRRVPLAALGSFPTGFTTINFLALEHLIPRLVDQERRSIADLEGDLKAIADADARARVEQLLAVKRKNLPLLEALAAPHPAGV